MPQTIGWRLALGATRLLIEPDLGFDRTVLRLVREPEPEALANSLHRPVLGEYVGSNAFDVLSPRDIYQAPQKFRAKASMMKIVADQDRHFRIVGSMRPGEPPYAQNLAAAGRATSTLGNQSHFSIVVNETDAGQSFVRRALVEIQQVEVAEVHATLR